MGFTYLAFAYMIALILTAILIFFAIWHVIAFDELKNDQKNPIEQCNTLNPLVLPEYISHTVMVLLIVLGGDLLTFFLNLPILIFNFNKYKNRPVMSRFGIYDPTLVMNGDVLNREMKEGWIKLAFYMVSFFYYLYSFISTLISSN
ncbi:cornichon -like protein [Brachionus plicatilis]|uniref:Cornichon-like protein n=1 Tax=Brachionus plicatilis TaxID=10195 RepID=A0A3M7RR18_BRAPC|nr:cornichon -like protein [Brachionus plicatilis]